MGIERHLRPLRVHHATSLLLEAGILAKEPPWYRVIASVPPSTSLVRVRPVQQAGHKQRLGKKKSKNFYQPQKLIFPEDSIRQRFYSDHPWELARPRIVVEDDGLDYARYDWSQMEQDWKQVDGESVVQRQMYLRFHAPKSERLSEKDAYDVARKEFYKLRMRQDIQRRVAAEEAEATGAVFGKSHIQVGMEIEAQVLAKWKEAARQDALERKRRSGLNSGNSMLDDEDDAKSSTDAAPAI